MIIINISNDEIISRLEKRSTSNDNHCKLWRGNKINGYGQISLEDKPYYVHRISAYIYLGLDLNNKEQLALHKCISRNCWNPEHLYIGNYSDNMQNRKKTKNSHFFGYTGPKTHCPHGHEYTPENTYLQGKTKTCKICRTIKLKKFRNKS